jgi:hypothetical protein
MDRVNEAASRASMDDFVRRPDVFEEFAEKYSPLLGDFYKGNNQVDMQTEVIDKLFLELSQVSRAKTARELSIVEKLVMLKQAVEPFAAIVCNSVGRIPAEQLSLSDWHQLSKALRSVNEFIEKEKR